jgi:hypothetical protein
VSAFFHDLLCALLYPVFMKALRDHLSAPEEPNHALALLSSVASETHIFPKRLELKNIRYSQTPLAKGIGIIHRGSDLNVCVKVLGLVDPGSSSVSYFVGTLITSKHPTILRCVSRDSRRLQPYMPRISIYKERKPDRLCTASGTEIQTAVGMK